MKKQFKDNCEEMQSFSEGIMLYGRREHGKFMNLKYGERKQSEGDSGGNGSGNSRAIFYYSKSKRGEIGYKNV